MNDTNHIALTYSDSDLRTLIEEYIIQQKAEFTINSVCAYIAYWAMEDGKAVAEGGHIYASNEIQPGDKVRVQQTLAAIIRDGRITSSGETYCRV